MKLYCDPSKFHSKEVVKRESFQSVQVIWIGALVSWLHIYLLHALLFMILKFIFNWASWLIHTFLFSSPIGATNPNPVLEFYLWPSYSHTVWQIAQSVESDTKVCNYVVKMYVAMESVINTTPLAIAGKRRLIRGNIWYQFQISIKVNLILL